MASTEAERRMLENLAAESNAFSSADADTLSAAGVPIWCLLAAAAELLRCGVTNPACQQAFLGSVLGCFGADRE